jgi:hypothetical protein
MPQDLGDDDRVTSGRGYSFSHCSFPAFVLDPATLLRCTDWAYSISVITNPPIRKKAATNVELPPKGNGDGLC